MYQVPRVADGEAQCQVGQQMDSLVDLLEGKDKILGHPVVPHGNAEGMRYHVCH